MDRPKHRRSIFLGSALLAGGALLLLARQWTAPPESIAQPARTPTQQLPSPVIDAGEPSIRIQTSADATPTTKAPHAKPAAGFRGRIIDAVTRQPVSEFEVKLVRVHNYNEEQPITKSFESKTGRFVWGDAPAGSWRAAVSARGYQQFNLDDPEISADKATREFVMPLLRGHALRGRVFEHSTGTGIAGAQISFQPSDGDEDYFGRRPRATSKDDGSFTLDGVPAGNVVVSVAASSHAPRSVEIAVDEKTPRWRLASSPAARSRGP